MATPAERQSRWREAHPEKVAARYSTPESKAALLAYNRDYYQKNKESLIYRYRESRYGLSREDYQRLLITQDNKCPICGGSIVGHRKASVDHCHKTGKVRSLLCSGCNRGLGLFKDDPELLRRAVQYLTTHGG